MAASTGCGRLRSESERKRQRHYRDIGASKARYPKAQRVREKHDPGRQHVALRTKKVPTHVSGDTDLRFESGFITPLNAFSP
jgi:hypothetical protein